MVHIKKKVGGGEIRVQCFSTALQAGAGLALIRSHLTAAKRLPGTCREKYPCDNQWLGGQRQEKSICGRGC